MSRCGFQAVGFISVVLCQLALLSVVEPQTAPPQQVEEQENRAFTTARGFPEYRIGPGDELRIRIWTGVEVKAYEIPVQADGTLFLPFVGLDGLKAEGRSALQLRDEIVERLRASFRHPAAEVVVKTRVARLVSLLGEIRFTQRGETGPGRYALQGRIRLMDFITEHGGVTEQADINRTQVMRGGQSYIYNLSDAIFQNDLSQNPILDDGDLVFVPPLSLSSRRYIVFGEVGRPGILQLPNEAPVAEVIAHAGGFTRWAHKSHVVVVRGELEQPRLLASNFEAMKKGDLSQNFMLEDGDMIFVGRRKLSTYFDIMRVFAEPLSILTTTAVLANAVSK